LTRRFMRGHKPGGSLGGASEAISMAFVSKNCSCQVSGWLCARGAEALKPEGRLCRRWGGQALVRLVGGVCRRVRA
jgi:hypothetical protein